MKPIDACFFKSLDAQPRVRFLGPDGGWRLGWFIVESLEGTAILFDEARREIVLAAYEFEFEFEPKRDDDGNPITDSKGQ